MARVLDASAVVVTAWGLAVLALGTLVLRWRDGLAAALELWVAAGLLHLAHSPDPQRLVAAAAIIAVRQVVSFGLRAEDPAMLKARR